MRRVNEWFVLPNATERCLMPIQEEKHVNIHHVMKAFLRIFLKTQLVYLFLLCYFQAKGEGRAGSAIGGGAGCRVYPIAGYWIGLPVQKPIPSPGSVTWQGRQNIDLFIGWPPHFSKQVKYTLKRIHDIQQKRKAWRVLQVIWFRRPFYFILQLIYNNLGITQGSNLLGKSTSLSSQQQWKNLECTVSKRLIFLLIIY